MSGNPYHPKRRLRATKKRPLNVLSTRVYEAIEKEFANPIEYAPARDVVFKIVNWQACGARALRWLLGWNVLAWVDPIPSRPERKPRLRCVTCTTRAAVHHFNECRTCMNRRIRRLAKEKSDASH